MPAVVTTGQSITHFPEPPSKRSAKLTGYMAVMDHISEGFSERISLQRRLQLTEGLHLKDDNWNFVSVDNSEQGTWPRVKGKLIVVGDCKHTPKEIEILPGTLDNNPGKFVLWLRCTHPPTFLPKGQTVAQIIPTWEHLEEDNIPTACPVHNITEVKPQVGCELQVGDEAINITGLLDTGADVTVIPAKHWPSRWALENVAGHVQGIGGMQLARQSKSVVQIKGPKGQLASLRPFVLDYREPLLGRDLMAQWGVTIDIPDPPQDFWAAVAEERPTHKLNWKTDAPVWVEQWPLSKQKLKALEELVEEQLAKGHIVETTSPWNSPVFVIRKPGKDKWRLLQDLRQINNVIEDMGSLQPGMPTPTMLPQNWKLAVIDIKDCFFHIPLHPDDAPRFAFSVPTVNREAPRKRYHWRVLPQGMKVSPIICQWYVASLLSPVRVAAEKAIIHHYMDDVLVCAPTDDVLSHALDLTINALVVAGFELQEDKVQRMPPWRYLGLEIGKRTIVPQKLEIKAKIQTLADVHQLCGALNWVRPWLGLTTEDLAPLFNLLKGGEELSSPRELTPEAKEALERVQHLMSTRQAHRCDPDLPFKFIIMGKLPHLHGVIFQWRNNIKKDQGREDPLLIIEWVFLSHQRSKRMTRPQELVAELIRKARVRIRELAGCDFECIHIPIGLRSGQITKAMLEHLLQENEALQFALDSFTGQISIHRPAHKIFNQDAKFTLNLKDVRSRKPLEALTVFTDASGKSHKSVMTWKDPQTQQWEADVAEVEGSPQVAELAAVVRAFERFPEPFNLVTDSAYVAGVVSRADQAILQEVSNTALFELLSKLVKLVSHREQPFFVMHTRSHTDLPGFVAEGNRRADALAAPAAMAPLPSIFEQAKLSHQLHHQNAPGLVRRFHITREQAKAIVATCPSFLLVLMEPVQRQSPVLRKFHLLLGVLLLASLTAPVSGWLVPQPKANVWATLARAMGQDHICLSATSADNPLMTCLVGIPYGPKELPARLLEITEEANREGSSKGQSVSQISPPDSFLFLICGDRAWAGIPPRLVGGPCTFGRLGLFSPNKTTLMNWQQKNSTRIKVQKRDLTSLDANCDSEIIHWSKVKGVAVTVFLPWVSIAKALGELAHLECWVAKQANLTSNALAGLLSDEEVTRQATLQNRAAIDYLLLLHGHRCEEFEGLCCFNLSTKAEDVHKAIQNIRDMVNDIKRETGDWLNGLFGDWGISGWVGSILKSVLLSLFVILLILIGFGIIKKMLSRLISSTTHAPSVNHVAVSSVPGWEEDVELEEDPEDRRHPEDEPQMEWPTQPEWLTESYPDFEYHPPPFQPYSCH
ncbi:hypothetical protein DUI87_17854 [Hirundo rustica rustica]|uniref:ribonuclease H n=1 Tax=Hirundo rustica rustica TaxID=333673 RepID=A0A3M0JZY3_HIRRU|nr:hypothetical protein DUI87_17854 [Hirundo rustica rustica]